MSIKEGVQAHAENMRGMGYTKTADKLESLSEGEQRLIVLMAGSLTVEAMAKWCDVPDEAAEARRRVNATLEGHRMIERAKSRLN